MQSIESVIAGARRLAGVGLALLLALTAACQPGSGRARTDDRLAVVASFSIVGDLARVVGGEHIQLTTLVGPGQDTHTYAATPADAKALAEAGLILENGLGFEPWLDRLYAASGSKAARLELAAGVTPRLTDDGEVDPHAWHDAANVIIMVETLRDALAAADPANAAAYRANAHSYVDSLRTLDAWVFTEVEALPAERRKLVTTHDTFGYFAARYGFGVLGTVLPASTEGASPSAQDLARLVEATQRAGVPAIFADSVAPNSLLDQVAREAGVQVVTALYTDALGESGTDGDTYISMMRANVARIVNALKP